VEETPHVDLNRYRLIVDGLVEQPVKWSFSELKQSLTEVEQISDFHCVEGYRFIKSEQKDRPDGTAPIGPFFFGHERTVASQHCADQTKRKSSSGIGSQCLS
jgi:hypothetical protein